MQRTTNETDPQNDCMFEVSFEVWRRVRLCAAQLLGKHEQACPVPVAIAHGARFLSVPMPTGEGAWEHGRYEHTALEEGNIRSRVLAIALSRPLPTGLNV